MLPLVPLLLEQFVGEDGVDLSIIDDCLRARPAANRCIFGRSKRFSTTKWLKQHPLSLIAEANHAPVYDHDIVKMCVDLKFQLFGNFLYLLILCAQVFFVCLYTGTTLGSPIPPKSYYYWANVTCKQLCQSFEADTNEPLTNHVFLREFDESRLRYFKTKNRYRFPLIRFTSWNIIVVLLSCIIERIFSIDYTA